MRRLQNNREEIENGKNQGLSRIYDYNAYTYLV